jgi:branched-chain amino acid transport system ATP-binding protein
LLERVGLSDRRDRMPMELAYGERRRLEIARGLATEPLVFLVDELAAGSTGAEQLGLAALIRHIAGTGAAVLLVEHHMDLISRVADRVLVLNFGETVTSGSYDEVRRDPRVVAAYLGAQEA